MSAQSVRYDLGQFRGGELLTVEVRERANVRSINSSNLRQYERGERFRCIGGQAPRSPARLPAGNAGHRFVVLDIGGPSGTIHSNVSVNG
jgi:hypothetical protein